MGRKLEQVKNDAREELTDLFTQDPEHPHLEDLVHEVADSHVPVYTADLIALFDDDAALLFTEPELGHGNAGDNMVGKAQAIIYEALTEDLYEHLTNLRDGYEEYTDERDRITDEIEEAEDALEEAQTREEYDEREYDIRNELEDLKTELDGLKLEDYIG